MIMTSPRWSESLDNVDTCGMLTVGLAPVMMILHRGKSRRDEPLGIESRGLADG